MKTALRRTLSLMLCVVMLVSCWVFTAPKADAGTAGSYKWRVNVASSNATGGWSTYNWTVYGKPDNGSGSETSIKTFSKKIDFNNTTNVSEDQTTSQFPTKVTFQYSFGAGITHRKMDATIYLDVYNNKNSSWDCVGSATAYSYEWGTNKGTITVTVATGNYPKADSVSAFSYSDLSVNSATASKTPSVTVKDQYGVEIGSPTLTFSKSSYKYDSTTGSNATNDISFSTSTGKVSAGSSGYKANSHQVHYVNASVSATFRTTDTATKTASLKMTYTQYTATYKYYTTKPTEITVNASDSSTKEYIGVGTGKTTNTIAAADSYKAYYGDTAGTPASTLYTNHYYTSDGHYYTGSYQAPTLTSSDDHYLSYKNGGSSYASSMASHVWSDWAKYTGTSEGMDASIYHRKTCTVGGDTHYKYQKHQWDSGSITTQPTCSAEGVKTYNCDCGAIKTEPVAIVSTNHSYIDLQLEGDTNRKDEATCLNNAVYYKVCSHNHEHVSTDTFTAANTALGHHFPNTWTELTTNETYNEVTYDKDVYHKRSCDRCDDDRFADKNGKWETEYDNHNYSTEIACNFAADHSATASRTCQTAGCGHVETKPAEVTSAVTTQPTCLTAGVRTYYAKSPYGGDAIIGTDTEVIPATGHDIEDVTDWDHDDTNHWKVCKNGCGIPQLPSPHGDGGWVYSDDTNDVTHIKSCKTAYDGELCGYSEREGHDYGDTTITFAGNGQTATASRICADCNHIQTETLTLANGYITTSVQTQPTCTTKGTTLYTATSPFADDDTEFGEDNPNTLPVQDIEKLPHSYGEWVVITEPTCTNEGLKRHTCTTCNNENPAFEEASIDAMGHHMEKVETEPLDGSRRPGLVYFYCTRDCGTYMGATYDPTCVTVDPETGEPKVGDYVADESKTYTGAGAEAAAKSEGAAKISSPTFNDYDEDFDGYEYSYSDRGAALKIAGSPTFTRIDNKANKTGRYTVQAMRFTASMQVPEGVDYRCGNTNPEQVDTDNIVTDFGFVYTQFQYFTNLNNFCYDETWVKDTEHPNPPNMVFKMSVKDNNMVKGHMPAFDGSNWTGVTLHNYKGSNLLTFNLVININAYNWSEDYCARAFVSYNYNGFKYTVYDSAMCEEKSVEWIASQVVDPDNEESERIVNYCQNKILTPISEGWNLSNP